MRGSIDYAVFTASTIILHEKLLYKICIVARGDRYAVHDTIFIAGPKWVYSPQKIAAQKIIGKYLQILGGDFAPLRAKS
jgi:hypothetical protein